MEGGKILYENVFFDPLPKLRQDEEFDILCEENVRKNFVYFFNFWFLGKL